MAFTVSILNNTNKIISSSEDNWGTIRMGSYIKIGNDINIYTIVSTNKIFYIKDFEVVNSKNIIINDDVGINLQNDDELKISYKQYELSSVLNIKKEGNFYAENDILSVVGGESVVDLNTGFSNPTKLIVKEVNERGGIKSLALKDNGKYIIPPNNPTEIIGGVGKGASLELEYSPSDNRIIVERVIKSLIIKDNKTFITLNYPISDKIKGGKLSVEKWEIILTSSYQGQSIKNAAYQIYKDYTPTLKIPLMLKNSQSFDVIFNKAMQIIDKEITELKNKNK